MHGRQADEARQLNKVLAKRKAQNDDLPFSPPKVTPKGQATGKSKAYKFQQREKEPDQQDIKTQNRLKRIDSLPIAKVGISQKNRISEKAIDEVFDYT